MKLCCVDGSREIQNGVEFAGFGVWFGQGEDRMECSPVPVTESQPVYHTCRAPRGSEVREPKFHMGV